MQGVWGVSVRNLGSETLPRLGLLWVAAGMVFTPVSRACSLGELEPPANTD